MPKLKRPWFAGGTVNFATVQGRAHILAPREAGLRGRHAQLSERSGRRDRAPHLERIGLETIQTRVACLTAWLLSELLELRHSNGRPMVRIYGPANTIGRGGTITLNFYDPDGHLLDYRRVEELAAGSASRCAPAVSATRARARPRKV